MRSFIDKEGEGGSFDGVGHAQHVVIEDWEARDARCSRGAGEGLVSLLLAVVCSHAHRAEKEAASGCKVHGVRNATPVLSGRQLKIGVSMSRFQVLWSRLSRGRRQMYQSWDPVPVRRSALACDQHGDRDFVPGRPGQGTRIVSITHPARQLRHLSEHAVEVWSLWPVEDRPLPAGNPDLPCSGET